MRGLPVLGQPPSFPAVNANLPSLPLPPTGPIKKLTSLEPEANVANANASYLAAPAAPGLDYSPNYPSKGYSPQYCADQALTPDIPIPTLEDPLSFLTEDLSSEGAQLFSQAVTNQNNRDSDTVLDEFDLAIAALP